MAKALQLAPSTEKRIVKIGRWGSAMSEMVDAGCPATAA
jgi:hypothetical protein